LHSPDVTKANAMTTPTAQHHRKKDLRFLIPVIYFAVILLLLLVKA